jgi:hypothetical protein
MSLFDAPRSALPRWDAASIDGFSTHSASADPWGAGGAQPQQHAAHSRAHAGSSAASASASGSSSRASSPQRRPHSCASAGADDAATVEVPAPLLDAWHTVAPGGARSPSVAPEQAARVLASSGIDTARVQQVRRRSAPLALLCV